MQKESRWIIASNRLPYQFDEAAQSLKLSSGGLVTAITGIHGDEQKIWVGAVLEQEASQWEHATLSNKTSLGYEPVVVNADEYNRYYNGFCNDVLWPLFHYQSERVQFRYDDWESYQRVNRLFAEKINEIATEDDIIWIHDFQLALVPKYLKELNPKLTVGWFLHIPFPSSELYHELPVRTEILEGILGADLVGFQDYGYLRHFCSTVKRVLGVETSLFAINFDSHHVALGVFPVSIDVDMFQKAAATPEVQLLSKEYKTVDNVLLGVDRLDYTKGVDLKIRSFYELLKAHPELHEKITLIQVAIPTRQDVDEYIRLRTDVEQLVSEVNGQFATPLWTPVHYLYHGVSFETLMALYRAADCLVVTSKRDGMNLVALEYVVTQSDKNPGVVVLSEFTGAKSLLSEAMVINPRDIEGTAQKMFEAINMPLVDKQTSGLAMMQYLQQYTATDWGRNFINKLTRISHKEHHKAIFLKEPSYFLGELPQEKTILFLDYDGTLAPLNKIPLDATLPDNMRQLLSQITTLSHVEIVIVSGRDQKFLEDQFRGLDVYLSAEHGAVFYNKKTWQSLGASDREQWYQHTLRIMRDYTKQVPGSFIEEKAYCVSWHYRKSPAEFAEYQALKLSEELQHGLSQLPARIVHGKKIIEVCAMEANKGAFVRWFLGKHPEYKQGVALGDDRTDEDIFIELADTKYVTVKVGVGSTAAAYRVSGQPGVFSLLSGIMTKGC